MLVDSFKSGREGTRVEGEELISTYTYEEPVLELDGDSATVSTIPREITFHTDLHVPKMGLMIVGIGGNNGTTVLGGCIANREKLSWHGKHGMLHANYYGSVTQSTCIRLGQVAGEEVYMPFKKVLPLVDPNEMVIGGWDINAMPCGDAMRRAAVFDYELQEKLYPFMQEVVPLPSVYYPDFIAANQEDRADNVLEGDSKAMHVEMVRAQIRDFKERHGLDKVVILWSGNTERFCEVTEGVHDTAENMLSAIEADHPEIAPSAIYAIASILEGCSYVNGSPQNTLVPGIVELAQQHDVLVAGDDFKSGQTKMKSVLADFLTSAGLKLSSIVSYNHLGNNDGKNLSAPKTFRSKEISKANVVDDVVAASEMLYESGETPDHCVVIKYVPFVGDSKRAMDEYISTIFMNGHNTIILHNTCEDSLLAAPIIIDLAIMTELFQRITYETPSVDRRHFDVVLSILGYFLKAPMVPSGQPIVNALFRQRATLENTMRIIAGLPVDSHLLLEQRAEF